MGAEFFQLLELLAGNQQQKTVDCSVRNQIGVDVSSERFHRALGTSVDALSSSGSDFQLECGLNSPVRVLERAELS